jgi:uncharacterized protein (TIGR02217 family)
MAAHEVQFPVNISYGSRGGPGYRTDVVHTDSGAEERIARWSEPRRRYDVAYGVKTNSDLVALQSFYIGRRGAEFSFRYKDWLDFTTHTDGGSAYTKDDHVIGTGDGATTTFQLVKRYTSGDTVRVRNIRKPVANKVAVAFDGVNQATGWSVNTATGIITFSVAPTLGVVITAGCEFDVPVRFEDSGGETLLFTLEDFKRGSSSVAIIEVIEEDTVSDEFYYGGAKITDPMAADVSIVEINGRVQVFNPSASGRKVTLPNPSALPSGGPYFYIVNISGTNSLDVRDHNNTNIGTVVANSMGVCVLAGTQWYFR